MHEDDSQAKRIPLDENAVAERVNGILKDELLLGIRFCSFEDALKSTKEAVTIDNNERIHRALDFVTPEFKHAA
jgi:putative transposase